MPNIVLSHLYRSGCKGELLCVLRQLGWFYTAVSRTKTRWGLQLETKKLPLEHMQTRRLDVLAEMARLRVLHAETDMRVHGTPSTAAGDDRRLQAAKAALGEAVRVFRRG